MKKLLLVLPLLILFSCTVQKRKYQKGFYVSRQHKDTREKYKDSPGNTALTGIKDPGPGSEITVPGKYLGIFPAQETKLLTPVKEKTHLISRPPEDTCDVLVFKDGSEIKGKVLEVGISEIKYKRCDALEGPNYISKKSDLFMIKYGNGTREVIKTEAPEPRMQAPVQKPSNYGNQRNIRQTHPLAAVSMLAGILAIVSIYMIAFSTSALGFGIFLLPFLLGLAAFISGKTSLKRMREQPEIWKGKGLARTGLIMGMIVLGIYALSATIVVLLLGI